MAESLAYLNGRYRPLAEAALPLADLGFLSGAVVTDNCRTWHGKLFRWSDHQTRFRRDCRDCRIPMPLDDEEFTRVAERLVAANAPEDVHVLTFATPGSHGVFTLPVNHARNRDFQERGVRLEIVGHQPADGDAVLPPRIKHRNRLHWHIAEHRVTEPGAIALLTDAPGGAITETAIAAVLAVKNGSLLMPPRSFILDSISLRVTLELAARLDTNTLETRLTRESLLNADEVLMTGTGFGLAGVSALDGYAIPWPGPLTQSLQRVWLDEVAKSA